VGRGFLELTSEKSYNFTCEQLNIVGDEIIKAIYAVLLIKVSYHARNTSSIPESISKIIEQLKGKRKPKLVLKAIIDNFNIQNQNVLKLYRELKK
jgi:hypothetical protein